MEVCFYIDKHVKCLVLNTWKRIQDIPYVIVLFYTNQKF